MTLFSDFAKSTTRKIDEKHNLNPDQNHGKATKNDSSCDVSELLCLTDDFDGRRSDGSIAPAKSQGAGDWTIPVFGDGDNSPKARILPTYE